MYYDKMVFLFLFILGTAIGSFLNVLIDRLPKGESIMGRSHCDHCKRTLQWYELVPIFSFFFSSGKSRCCGKKLSIHYPVIETLTGLTFILIFNFQFLNLLQIISIFGIASCFIVIFFADLKYQIIPDSIQVALLVLVIALHLTPIINHPSSILPLLISGLVVMLPILLLYLVTRGRGMGFGDVKLSFSVGLLLGISQGLIALYFAFISGAVIGVLLLISGKKGLRSKVPFGPFIIIGIIIILVFWQTIIHLFYKTYGITL